MADNWCNWFFFNWYGYCLWVTPKFTVHVDSPPSLQELRDNVWRDVANISRQLLHIVVRNVFGRHEAYLGAVGHHFKTDIRKKVHWIAG
jgi:hypothetical protein